MFLVAAFLLLATVSAAPLFNSSTPEHFLNSTLQQASASFMDCGSAPLCGVMVLESGKGSQKYSHPAGPVVHGLWPESGSYGSSKCIAPADATPPASTHTCYDDLTFAQHEWAKHGACAGVADADAFFTLVCSLSAAPLEIMKSSDSLTAMSDALSSAGFPVFFVDSSSDSQIYLSVCSSGDGKWLLAKPEEFSAKCGSS